MIVVAKEQILDCDEKIICNLCRE